MAKIDRIYTSKHLLGFPEITTPWRLGCGLSSGGYLTFAIAVMASQTNLQTATGEAGEQASANKPAACDLAHLASK